MQVLFLIRTGLIGSLVLLRRLHVIFTITFKVRLAEMVDYKHAGDAGSLCVFPEAVLRISPSGFCPFYIAWFSVNSNVFIWKWVGKKKVR